MSGEHVIKVGALAHFLVDSDPDKYPDGDPGLVCEWCGELICTVEDGDTLSVLATTALGHECSDDPDDPHDDQGNRLTPSGEGE